MGWIAPFWWTRDQQYFLLDGEREPHEAPVWIQREFPKMTLGSSTHLQPKSLQPLGHTLLSQHQLLISSEWLCHHLFPPTRIYPKKAWKLPGRPAEVLQLRSLFGAAAALRNSLFVLELKAATSTHSSSISLSIKCIALS